MFDRIFVYALSAFLALAPAQAFASQNALLSPATGTVSGLQLTNNYNNALDSVNTMNSGPSAPTNQLSGTPSRGNWWLNTTASPDPAQVYDGANWLAPFYVDTANHLILPQLGGGIASVASASTVDLCSGIPQNRLTITGTTTITSFGSTCPTGVIKVLFFGASLTLTYNAGSMILPGAANVATSAGDIAVAQALGSGNWQIISYTLASGQALINSALDVGDYLMTALTAPPSSKYLFAFGQAISRTTYATLLTNITITQSVTATNGSPTLTGFSDTTQIATGAKVEAAFLPSSPVPTVVSCTSTTCLLSGNATASTTGNVTIFPYGDGDGTTTFNLPDCRDMVMAGRPNMGGTDRGLLTSTYFGTNPAALGATGGAQNRTLAQANLGASWNFPVTGTGSIGNLPLCDVSGCFNSFGLVGSAAFVGAASGNTTGWLGGTAPTVTMGGNASSAGSGTPLATVQPTMTANCMMRVLAMLRPSPLDRAPAAVNDNAFAAIEPQRLAA